MYPHVGAPLENQAVTDLVCARGKEMQAEDLKAQVAAQVCMDLERASLVLGSISVDCVGWQQPGSVKLASLP